MAKIDRNGVSEGFFALGIASIQVTNWIRFFGLRPSDRQAAAHVVGWGLDRLSFGVMPGWGLGQVVGVAGGLWIGVVVGLSPRRGVVFRLTALAIFLSATINYFSVHYWAIGTPANFSQSLTPLDATYFAFGTLVTVGSSPISATSETARGWLTAQLAVDFLVLATVLGIALNQASARLSRDRKSSPPPPAEEESNSATATATPMVPPSICKATGSAGRRPAHWVRILVAISTACVGWGLLRRCRVVRRVADAEGAEDLGRDGGRQAGR